MSRRRKQPEYQAPEYSNHEYNNSRREYNVPSSDYNLPVSEYSLPTSENTQSSASGKLEYNVRASEYIHQRPGHNYCSVDGSVYSQHSGECVNSLNYARERALLFPSSHGAPLCSSEGSQTSLLGSQKVWGSYQTTHNPYQTSHLAYQSNQAPDSPLLQCQVHGTPHRSCDRRHRENTGTHSSESCDKRHRENAEPCDRRNKDNTGSHSSESGSLSEYSGLASDYLEVEDFDRSSLASSIDRMSLHSTIIDRMSYASSNLTSLDRSIQSSNLTPLDRSLQASNLVTIHNSMERSRTHTPERTSTRSSLDPQSSLQSTLERSSLNTRRRRIQKTEPGIQSEPASPGHNYGHVTTTSHSQSPGHSQSLVGSSPGHSYSSGSPGHSYREDMSWREESTAGCCSVRQTDPVYSSLHGKDPSVSACMRNFVSWMANKAGKGTTALLDALPSVMKEDLHIVMIGLDGAGKTTVLYRIKFDQYINAVPTIGFNCEKVKGTVGQSKGLSFLIWDVGGQEKIRPLWRSYTRCTDGIIFVVDSSDMERLEEAKVELFRTLRYNDNASVPLLVLANKQDLPSASHPQQLQTSMDLGELPTPLWHLEPCCAVTGEGLDTGIEILYQLILKRKKLAKRQRNKTR